MPEIPRHDSYVDSAHPIDAQSARQGETPHIVRYVLAASLALALLAAVVLYATHM